MVKVYFIDLYEKKKIPVEGEFENRAEASVAAAEYAKNHGLPWDKYQRFWRSEDNKGTYCDFGSWSYWLYYEGEEGI